MPKTPTHLEVFIEETILIFFSLIYYYLVNKKNKNGGINHDKEF